MAAIATAAIDGTTAITLDYVFKIIGLCLAGFGLAVAIIAFVFKMLHKDLKLTLTEVLKGVQAMVLNIGDIKKDIEYIKIEQHDMKQEQKDLKIKYEDHEKKIQKISVHLSIED